MENVVISNEGVIKRLKGLNSSKALESDELHHRVIKRTKAYKDTSEEEKSVVNGHYNHLALQFSVCVKERQDRLPTMYWLPTLHKRPYKARFIANSTELSDSKLLTSCLTAVKTHVVRYCEKVYERSGQNLFWSIKSSGEVLNKLKSRGFRATSLSTARKTGLSPPVFLYWPFQGGTSVVVPYCSCCLCLYFGSSIMLVTYFVNFR